MRHRGTVHLLVGACVAIAACDSSVPPEVVVPNALRITPESLSFDAIGDTIRVRATLIDGNGRELPGTPRVTWSTNTLAVRVDTGGLVRAASAGPFLVVATTGRLQGAAVGSVRQTPVTVTVTPEIDSVVGQTGAAFYTAVVRDRLGNVIVNPTVAWQSSNDSVATVQEGAAISQGSGIAIISATSGSARGEARIVVSRPPWHHVITASSPALEGDTIRDVTIRILDRHGRPILRDADVRVVARFLNGDSSVQVVRSQGAVAKPGALVARAAGVARLMVGTQVPFGMRVDSRRLGAPTAGGRTPAVNSETEPSSLAAPLHPWRRTCRLTVSA
jgi:hypothetical protein